jgi:hypothetical protein
MSSEVNPIAPHHLPMFITAPGETDFLFYGALFFLIFAVLLVVVFYFKLHSLPERIAHKGQMIQFELVAVLALISLFTHNHLFWIAGLLLAFIPIPDLSTPLSGMADSLATMAGRRKRAGSAGTASAPTPEGIASDSPGGTEAVLHHGQQTAGAEARPVASRPETPSSAEPAAPAFSGASAPASRVEPDKKRLAASKERA